MAVDGVIGSQGVGGSVVGLGVSGDANARCCCCPSKKISDKRKQGRRHMKMWMA